MLVGSAMVPTPSRLAREGARDHRGEMVVLSGQGVHVRRGYPYVTGVYVREEALSIA